MTLKKKNCSTYELGTAERKACERYNWWVNFLNLRAQLQAGGDANLPAEVMALIEDLIASHQDDPVWFAGSDFVFDSIQILRENQLPKLALEISQTFTRQLDTDSPHHVVLLSRNMQLQGRVLETLNQPVEAQQAFSMALNLSQLAGRIAP